MPSPRHYAELPGSESATFDTSAIVSIERRFVVPWAERNRFARRVAEYPHPTYRYARPTRITIQPFMGEGEVSIQPVNPFLQTIAYQHALITVQYQIDPVEVARWPTGIPVPQRREGTTLELRLSSGGEFLMLEGAVWADNTDEDPSKPVPEEGSPALRLYVAQREIEIVWHRVDDLSVERFEALKGCVNDDTFLGCPAETLLFESYSVSPEVVLDPEEPVRWAVSCSFLHRELKTGTAVYGWNHEYRRDGIQRVQIRGADGALQDRYLKASFTHMFT